MHAPRERKLFCVFLLILSSLVVVWRCRLKQPGLHNMTSRQKQQAKQALYALARDVAGFLIFSALFLALTFAFSVR